MPLHLMLIFFVVMSLVTFSLSAYALTRLQHLLEVALALDSSPLTDLIHLLGEPSTWGASAGLIACYFAVGSFVPARPLRWLGWVSGAWMGQLALLLFFAGPAHIVAWGGSLAGIDLTLGARGARVLLTLIEGALLVGLWRAAQPPLLRELEVSDPEVGEGLDGFRILQLSDVHIGPTIGSRFVERLHERCAAIRPDLIVMTGDLVDGHPRYLRDEVRRFLALGEYAHHGLYLITGNHEYISGAQVWVDEIRAMGGAVLENEHITIDADGDELHLIGVEDWDASKFDPRRAPMLDRALEGLEGQSGFKLLLAHQPKAAPEASTRGVHLQLSGHTHGGQIFPFNFLIYLDQPYNRGRYQLGGLTLYVNEGTGYWGPPLRLGTRAELTLVTLRSPNAPTPTA